jgi:hypothetical protein
MYYILYKTKNNINDKIYIGVHKTNNLEDNYLGSGKTLIKAIRKYGKNNFKRTIIRYATNEEDMYKLERLYVTERFIKSKNTYNLKLGGEGGWKFINDNRLNHSEESNKSRKIKCSQAHKDGKYKHVKRDTFGFKGKKHTNKSKKKISKNNAMTLTEELIKSRNEDINEYPLDVFGNVQKLANKWNISHTQVRRFVKKYICV